MKYAGLIAPLALIAILSGCLCCGGPGGSSGGAVSNSVAVFQICYNAASPNICYLKQAEKRNDVKLCDEIDKWDLKVLCRGNVMGEVSQCGQFASDVDKATCAAIVGNSPSNCSLIGDSDFRQSCYSSLALLKSNPKACRFIEDEDKRKVCEAPGYFSMYL